MAVESVPYSRLTRREALGILGAGAAALSQGTLTAATEPQFPKGAVIRTVLKDLPPSALAGGSTLMHEHLTQSTEATEKIAAANAHLRGVAPPPPRPPDAISGCPNDVWEGCSNLTFMLEELKRVKADGVACIVDGAHPDLGRDIRWLAELSRRSGLAVVGSGGYYLDYTYPPEVLKGDEDQVAELMIQDATKNPVGAFGEMGASAEITPNERKVFRAVSKAHLATGCPIFTHTSSAKNTTDQLDIFESMGVKPQHVVIGHITSINPQDVDLFKSLCKRGAFLGFDRQGGPNDDRNVPTILQLLQAGYKDNLVFSGDFGTNNPPSSQNWKQNGGQGIDKAITVWVPKLRAAGVDEATLHDILVNNPRRWLAFVPKNPRANL
jgi:phosphotriesterase-related protein